MPSVQTSQRNFETYVGDKVTAKKISEQEMAEVWCGVAVYSFVWFCFILFFLPFSGNGKDFFFFPWFCVCVHDVVLLLILKLRMKKYKSCKSFPKYKDCISFQFLETIIASNIFFCLFFFFPGQA